MILLPRTTTGARATFIILHTYVQYTLGKEYFHVDVFTSAQGDGSSGKEMKVMLEDVAGGVSSEATRIPVSLSISGTCVLREATTDGFGAGSRVKPFR